MKIKKIFWLLILLVLLAGPAYGASLTLTWTDNSGNEDGFKIERKLEQTGTFAEIGTVAADIMVYVDSTIPDGQLYCYRVRAFNAEGDSPYSNEDCGRDVPVLLAPSETVVTKTVTTTTTTTTTTPAPVP